MRQGRGCKEEQNWRHWRADSFWSSVAAEAAVVAMMMMMMMIQHPDWHRAVMSLQHHLSLCFFG